MRIFVKNKNFIRSQFYRDETFFVNNNVINIRDSDDKYRLPVVNSCLRLIFDDITKAEEGFVLFDTEHADKIIHFIESIDQSKDLYVNCAAGISRSGAVSYCLNEYFNKYLDNNVHDYELFFKNNSQIMPNPHVKKVLHNTLFGQPDYSNMFKEVTSDDINKYKDMFLE